MSVQWIRGSQISEELITLAEKEYGILLPEDVKVIVRNNNNGRPSLLCFDSPKSKEHVFKKLLSFKQEDRENIYKARRILSQIDSTMFPIANDSAGNLICVKDGKIVYLLHETNEVEFLANSFSEFLATLY